MWLIHARNTGLIKKRITGSHKIQKNTFEKTTLMKSGGISNLIQKINLGPQKQNTLVMTILSQIFVVIQNQNHLPSCS